MSGWRYNPDGTDLSAAALEATYQRDSTLEYKALRTKAIADSYKDPSDYFKRKAQAITDASKRAATVYREEYQLLVAKKIPAALAHTRAVKMASAYEGLLVATIEDDFPSDLSNLSLQLTYDRGEAATPGFAKPSTSMGGGRKARK